MKTFPEKVSQANLAMAIQAAATIAAGSGYRLNPDMPARIVNFAIDLLEEIENRRNPPPAEQN